MSLENYKFKNNNKDLSCSELKKFASFIFCLVKHHSEKKISLIYRGENLSDAIKILGCNKKNFNQAIFLIGSKGRHYRKQYIEKKDRYSFDDISDGFFEHIFTKLNNALRNTKNPSLIEFATREQPFTSYFIKKTNRNNFLATISMLKDTDKLKARDYYLTILHHIGKIGFHARSFLLSTSTKFSVAKKFAESNQKNDGIIYFSWLPSQKLNNAFPISPSRIKQKLINIGLPTSTTSIYRDQKEISLKGGLLPHYIIGYFNLNNMTFEINPNLLNDNNNPEQIIKNGIEIDQSDFYTSLEQTNYKASFIMTDNGSLYDIF